MTCLILSRMDERVVAAMHADFRHDLCAGVDVEGLVGHKGDPAIVRGSASITNRSYLK